MKKLLFLSLGLISLNFASSTNLYVKTNDGKYAQLSQDQFSDGTFQYRCAATTPGIFNLGSYKDTSNPENNSGKSGAAQQNCNLYFNPSENSIIRSLRKLFGQNYTVSCRDARSNFVSLDMQNALLTFNLNKNTICYINKNISSLPAQAIDNEKPIFEPASTNLPTKEAKAIRNSANK